jgi:hypothetical protein
VLSGSALLFSKVGTGSLGSVLFMDKDLNLYFGGPRLGSWGVSHPGEVSAGSKLQRRQWAAVRPDQASPLMPDPLANVHGLPTPYSRLESLC